MRTYARPAIAFFAALLVATHASAAPPAPTNMVADYPKANCVKPAVPPQPAAFNNQLEMQLWATIVERYNASRAEYTACVKAYIAAAQADVNRITEASNALVEEANKQQ